MSEHAEYFFEMQTEMFFRYLLWFDFYILQIDFLLFTYSYITPIF